MEIRKASLKEVPEIAERLWKKGLIEYHQKRFRTDRRYAPLKRGAVKTFISFVSKNIRSPNALVLVALDRGRIVGYSLNYIRKNIPVFRPDRYGYLSDLYIDEKYRGGGIASEFRKHAIRWFKKKGMKMAAIAVHAGNKKALDIYRKWGFEDYHIELRKRI